MSDETKWRPWVTYALIAANIAMFAVELGKGAGLTGATPKQMIELGGDFAPLTLHGEWWRLLSAMFLHYGALHIGMNMLCLYRVSVVERMIGRCEFLAVYLAAGLLGGIASLMRHSDAVGAGASGAVFGAFGAFAAIMIVRRAEFDPQVWSRTMRSLGSFFGLNLVIGLSSPTIDMSAHVGGLITGFVAGFVLAKTAKPSANQALRALLTVVLAAGLAAGALVTMKPAHDFTALLSEFDRLEHPTLARYHELFATWRDHSVPDPVFADALEHDVVAPYVAYRAKLEAFPSDETPARLVSLSADLKDYVGKRIAWWQAMAREARSPDDPAVSPHIVNGLSHDADDAVHKLNATLKSFEDK